jgi:hypothetical protein
MIDGRIVDVLEPGQTSVTDQPPWRDFCAAAAKDLSLLYLGGHVVETVLRGYQFAEESYVAIADRLEELFGPWEGWHVVEVGGGYGGQARVLMQRHPCSYWIVDLPEPSALQAAYLASHEFALTERTRGDLFISNYALSECARDVQLGYLEVAASFPRGYIAWNGWSLENNLSKDEFAAIVPGSTWIADWSVQQSPTACLVWGER